MPVTQQIKKFIDDQKIGKSELARILEVTHTTIAGIYEQKRNPRSDILEKLLIAFPNLSAQWLLTGEGQMWRDEMITQTTVNGGSNVAQVNQVQEPSPDHEAKQAHRIEAEALKIKVEQLQARVDTMTQYLADQRELIDMLKAEVQRLKEQ